MNILLCALAAWNAAGAPPSESPVPYPELTEHRRPRPLTDGAVTEDWATFLGPSHDATSREKPLLKSFSDNGPPLVWEMKAGAGYAGPAVSGSRLVYFHRVGDHEVVDCLDAVSGRRYWRHAYGTSYVDRYDFNNGPRSSPVIADGRVYTHGAEGRLHCLDLATGAVLWQHDTSQEYGIAASYFGVGCTPLVEGELLIVAVGAPGPGAVAYDRRNGRVVWTAADDWAASYASPIPGTVHGRRRVFIFAGGDTRPPTGGLLGIDPANGHVDFRFAWRPSKYESVNAASPVIIDNGVLISTAYRKGAALVEVQPDGSARPAWTSTELQAHWATPIHRDGHIYGFSGNGPGDTALVCLEARSGRTVWRAQPEWQDVVERNGRREPASMGLMRGSLLWADGAFLALGEMGHLAWLDLTPSGCTVMCRSWLFPARESFTLPVLSHGLLYVTQNLPGLFGGSTERLLCYDLRGAAP